MMHCRRYSISLVCLLSSYLVFGQITTYKQDIAKYRSENWKGLIKDPRTTLKAGDSTYLRYYPIKEKYKVYAQVTLLENQPPFEMPTYAGLVKEFRKYALLKFNWKNQPVTLTVYQNIQNITSPIYKNYLFIPFKDLTTGRQTYDGGRYMDIKMQQIQNGSILLDLNQIYNPWCAYSDGYNCPIPPSENHLAIKLTAGEKMFVKKH